MKYCQYCLPSLRRYHWDLHVDYYLGKLTGWLPRMPAEDLVWKLILKIGQLFGLVKIEREPDERFIYNRSLIIFNEARERGIDIAVLKIAGLYKNEFQYAHRGRTRYFESIPLVDSKNAHLIDNKYNFRNFLSGNGVPFAPGNQFTSLYKALDFAGQIGYPVVVKPSRGSLGQHSSYPIDSETGLKEAIRIAQMYRPDFLVEKFITGRNYRATVVGKKHVFVCEKELPNVIGNGGLSITELINEKNNHPWRSDSQYRNVSLSKIPFNQQLTDNLSAQNLDLLSVLPSGQQVYLFKAFLIGTGCDIINRTNETAKPNVELFKNIAALLDTNIVGLDLIAEF